MATGIHYSLAKRVIQMGNAANIRFKRDIVFSGGVARNIGMVKAVEDLLGEEVAAEFKYGHSHRRRTFSTIIMYWIACQRGL